MSSVIPIGMNMASAGGSSNSIFSRQCQELTVTQIQMDGTSNKVIVDQTGPCELLSLCVVPHIKSNGSFIIKFEVDDKVYTFKQTYENAGSSFVTRQIYIGLNPPKYDTQGSNNAPYNIVTYIGKTNYGESKFESALFADVPIILKNGQTVERIYQSGNECAVIDKNYSFVAKNKLKITIVQYDKYTGSVSLTDNITAAIAHY